MSTGSPPNLPHPTEPRSGDSRTSSSEHHLQDSERNSALGQLDLFDHPAGHVDVAPLVLGPAIDPASMSDEELVQRFIRASLSEVETLALEIKRRRPRGWTDAAAALWERFLGYGANWPMPEQVAVLELVRQTEAAPLLLQLVRRAPIAECLDPHLLCAAATCGVPLPQSTVLRGLAHAQSDVRAAAVRVAPGSKVPIDRLHQLLTDSVRDVRRTAATVIAEAGDAAAREPLLLEMRLQPDRRGLEALSSVANEDVIIRLGQIARRHRAWREVVIEVLHMIDDPKAETVAAGLETDPG